CAVGALGGIGEAASPALPSLRDLRNEPALQRPVELAMSRITAPEAPTAPRASFAPGVEPPGRAVRVGGKAETFPEKPKEREEVARDEHEFANLPLDWDASTGRNIVWSIELGDETFGRPVVRDGVVYVGTDNARKRNPAWQDECGVLLA